MLVKLTVYLILLSLLTNASNTRIIRTTVQVPHQLFDLTNNTIRNTTVPFTLYARLPRRRSPLLIILPGGLLLASDYQTLSSAFAYRRFIVAVPQYDQRPLPTSTPPNLLAHVNFTSTLKPPCPRNGQFSSAALVQSFLTHVSERSNAHWVLRKMLLDRIVVFGHSFGGVAALFLVSGQCENINPMDVSQLQLSLACEQKARLPPRTRIVGLALFDGIAQSPTFRFPIPSDLFVSVLESPFATGNPDAALQSNGNLVQALISDVNHFGPNDFTNATMSPRCAFPRPLEAMFRTDFRTQRTAISAIATIVSRSYLVFFKGRNESILTQIPNANSRVETLSIS